MSVAECSRTTREHKPRPRQPDQGFVDDLVRVGEQVAPHPVSAAVAASLGSGRPGPTIPPLPDTVSSTDVAQPESFLPFDLEQTFSAAFVLTLMTAVPGLPTRNGEYVQTAFGILDTMMARGNVVARYRREELEKLQEMLRLAQARLFQAAPAAGGDVMDSTDNLGLDTQSANVLPTNHVGQDVPGEGGPATGSTANGLASEQMLSIAGLLDWEPNVAALEDDQLAGNWLWTDPIAPDFDFGGELL